MFCTSSAVSTVSSCTPPPTPLVAQAPFRMMGFLLMLLVDLRGAEPQALPLIALPLIALPLADCWRASGPGWGLWAEQVEAG